MIFDEYTDTAQAYGNETAENMIIICFSVKKRNSLQ